MFKPKFRIFNAEFEFYLLKYLCIIANLIIIIIKVNVIISIVNGIIKKVNVIIGIVNGIIKKVNGIVRIVNSIFININVISSKDEVSQFSTLKKNMPFLSIQINVNCFVFIIYLCFKKYENYVLSTYNYKLA